MHLLFAWRYFRAKKSTNVINIIAWICIVAIVIGTAALILVLSVFNGFEGLVKSLYSSFYPDIKITPANGKTMTLTNAQLQQLRGLSDIRNFSLVVEEKAILQSESNQALVYLKGVDTNYATTTSVATRMQDGSFEIGNAQKPQLVLGAGVEASLGIRADRTLDPLMVYIPRRSESEELDQASNISSDTIRTSGAFVIQQDFDNKYAITDLHFLQSAMQLSSNEYSAVEIAVKNPTLTDKIRDAIAKQFGNDYKVQNRYQQNQSLYSVMNLERWVFYAVLSMILVVAAFNMVGTLTMLVLEKQKDISILTALGANQKFILKIFLSEGFLLALLGGAIGMILALIMIILQQQFHIVPLQGGSFVIDYFPVKPRIFDFVLVALTVLAIAFLASWMPAYKASKQDFSLRTE